MYDAWDRDGIMGKKVSPLGLYTTSYTYKFKVQDEKCLRSIPPPDPRQAGHALPRIGKLTQSEPPWSSAYARQSSPASPR